MHDFVSRLHPSFRGLYSLSTAGHFESNLSSTGTIGRRHQRSVFTSKPPIPTRSMSKLFLQILLFNTSRRRENPRHAVGFCGIQGIPNPPSGRQDSAKPAGLVESSRNPPICHLPLGGFQISRISSQCSHHLVYPQGEREFSRHQGEMEFHFSLCILRENQHQ